jgi:teichuronic acid biosynthesis glycosyltransferase TuaH
VKVLFLSHTSWTSPFRVGSHHYARELAALGDDVTYVSTPVTPAHALRLRDHIVRDRLRTAVRQTVDRRRKTRSRVPLTVVPLGRVGAADALVRRTVARLTPPQGWDVALVDQPLFAGVLDGLTCRSVIYRPTDVHVRGRLRDCELRLLERCHAVVSTSQAVLDSLSLRDSVPRLVLENGVELSRFTPATFDERPTTAVYAGALDHRFDWELVGHLGEQFPEVKFDLVGPLAQRPPLGMPRNVRLVGAVSYARLPELLQRHKVGLLPFNDHEANVSRSPMKYYEYLAAGLFVLARATPTLQARAAVEGVALYRTHEEAHRQFRALLDRTGANPEGAHSAAAFDWPSRALLLRCFIEEVSLAQAQVASE